MWSNLVQASTIDYHESLPGDVTITWQTAEGLKMGYRAVVRQYPNLNQHKIILVTESTAYSVGKPWVATIHFNASQTSAFCYFTIDCQTTRYDTTLDQILAEVTVYESHLLNLLTDEEDFWEPSNAANWGQLRAIDVCSGRNAFLEYPLPGCTFLDTSVLGADRTASIWEDYPTQPTEIINLGFPGLNVREIETETAVRNYEIYRIPCPPGFELVCQTCVPVSDVHPGCSLEYQCGVGLNCIADSRTSQAPSRPPGLLDVGIPGVGGRYSGSRTCPSGSTALSNASGVYLTCGYSCPGMAPLLPTAGVCRIGYFATATNFLSTFWNPFTNTTGLTTFPLDNAQQAFYGNMPKLTGEGVFRFGAIIHSGPSPDKRNFYITAGIVSLEIDTDPDTGEIIQATAIGLDQTRYEVGDTRLHYCVQLPTNWMIHQIYGIQSTFVNDFSWEAKECTDDPDWKNWIRGVDDGYENATTLYERYKALAYQGNNYAIYPGPLSLTRPSLGAASGSFLVQSVSSPPGLGSTSPHNTPPMSVRYLGSGPCTSARILFNTSGSPGIGLSDPPVLPTVACPPKKTGTWVIEYLFKRVIDPADILGAAADPSYWYTSLINVIPVRGNADWIPTKPEQRWGFTWEDGLDYMLGKPLTIVLPPRRSDVKPAWEEWDEDLFDPDYAYEVYEFEARSIPMVNGPMVVFTDPAGNIVEEALLFPWFNMPDSNQYYYSVQSVSFRPDAGCDT